MSTDLHWRPAVEPPPSRGLAFDLKKAMARRFWDHDGSLYGDEIEFGPELIPYLEGLQDAGVSGAGELIDAIREHERVVVWIS